MSLLDRLVKTVLTVITVILLAFAVSFIILIVVSVFIPGEYTGNKCEGKAMVKNLINISKTDYKLGGSNLLFKVDDWGELYYGLWSTESEGKGDLCEAKTEYSLNSSPAMILIGYEDASGKFVELTNIGVNIYAYANPDRADSYEFERLVQSMVDSHKISKDQGGHTLVSHTSSQSNNNSNNNLTGKYSLSLVNGDPSALYPQIISLDEGKTWQLVEQ